MILQHVASVKDTVEKASLVSNAPKLLEVLSCGTLNRIVNESLSKSHYQPFFHRTIELDLAFRCESVALDLKTSDRVPVLVSESVFHTLRNAWV